MTEITHTEAQTEQASFLLRGRTVCAQPIRGGVIFTLLSLFISVPVLWLSTQAYPSLLDAPIWESYLQHPLILLLNFLPPIILLWGFTVLWNRPWVGYCASACISLALALGNYFKISLRGDPVTIYDLTLLGDAAKIAGEYTLKVTPAVAVVLVCVIIGQIAVWMLFPRKLSLSWKRRVGGTVGIALMAGMLYAGLYASETVYQMTENNDHIDRWSRAESYLSRGLWYPFLSSGRAGATYTSNLITDFEGDIPRLLAEYSEGKQAVTHKIDNVTDDVGLTPIKENKIIPKEDREVEASREISVVGVMLEAFCDLTDYPSLARYKGVRDVYEFWRQMEEESLYGTLITNSFGGGTVNTEWGFLTGLPDYQPFTYNTDSYVWYLRSLGYTTQGSHTGYCDFYDRVKTNHYLGFETYRFSENYYGQYVDPAAAFWRSDDVMVDGILNDLEGAFSQGDEVFSFSVSYQNHGPYDVAADMSTPLIPESSPLSHETRGIIQTYLSGIRDTMEHLERMKNEIDAMPEPVVLVLFGDHKPWLGNDYSCYIDAEINFDQSTVEGVSNYYSTPYLIWGNRAAREYLGEVPQGKGETISPCFLMNQVFQYCGWEEPAVMEISSEMMDVTPVIHQTGRYLYDGDFVESLEEPYRGQLTEYFALHQYRREHVLKP